jgi:hypothetical protein
MDHDHPLQQFEKRFCFVGFNHYGELVDLHLDAPQAC